MMIATLWFLVVKCHFFPLIIANGLSLLIVIVQGLFRAIVVNVLLFGVVRLLTVWLWEEEDDCL